MFRTCQNNTRQKKEMKYNGTKRKKRLGWWGKTRSIRWRNFQARSLHGKNNKGWGEGITIMALSDYRAFLSMLVILKNLVWGRWGDVCEYKMEDPIERAFCLCIQCEVIKLCDAQNKKVRYSQSASRSCLYNDRAKRLSGSLGCQQGTATQERKWQPMEECGLRVG